MQIGSGQSPLATAVMKALGVQAPASPAAPAPAASAPGTSSPAKSSPAASSPPAAAVKAAPQPGIERASVAAELPADLSGNLGVAKTIPRGSFVDFKA